MSETGRLLDVKRMAVHDGPGIRTTLFLKGCPLRCRWCHNPESMSPRPQLAYYEHQCVQCGECAAVCPTQAQVMTDGQHRFDRSKCRVCGACAEACLGNALRLCGKTVTVEEARRLAVEDREFYVDGGGVTLSGGEPLLQPEFCFELLTALKRDGIATAVDTCGCVGWSAFETVIPVTDLFLFDIKHADSAKHRELTGQGHELILENLRRLSARGAKIEIRIPLVPGCNDDEVSLQATGALLGGLRIERVRLLPYHALARNKYAAIGLADTLPAVSSPDLAALRRAAEILRSHGVPVASDD